MLIGLDTPYVDTCAADLSLALGGPELPALHVRDLTLPGGIRLRLRLLGASHQVVLTTSDDSAPASGAITGDSAGPASGAVTDGSAGITGGDALIETVACLPGRPPHLPGSLHDEAGGYRFTAAVLRPVGGELHDRIATLRAELADDPYALVGVFPGDPDAVTALAVRPDLPDGSIGWRTWHAYPQTNELVLTETVVALVSVRSEPGLRAPQSRTEATLVSVRSEPGLRAPQSRTEATL